MTLATDDELQRGFWNMKSRGCAGQLLRNEGLVASTPLKGGSSQEVYKPPCFDAFQFLWKGLKFKTFLYTNKHGEKHFLSVVWILWINFLCQVICWFVKDLLSFHSSGVSRIGSAETTDMIRFFYLKLHVNYYWRELCDTKKLVLFLYNVKSNSLEAQLLLLLECFLS